MRRSMRYTCAVIVTVLVVACGSAAPTTTTSTTTTTIPPTTTSTVPPTTTTTLPPFEVEGAPAELADLVEQFYDFTAGRSNEAPPLPESLASITPVERETPLHGVASVGAFRGHHVATVEMGPDLFLAVDDGSGWRFVGGNWPDLGLVFYGHFPRHIAVIGSDARPGENQDRSRGDSIHVVGLNGPGAGGIVGIPRDSYVSIPGVGNNKINAALSRGGPDVMNQTIANIAGIPMEGYVLTGFEGFMVMAGEVLGGMEIDVPHAINDSAAGAIFEAGRQYVNGVQALAFARVRKTVRGGDFTRSQFQGQLLLAAVEIVQRIGYGEIPRLMEGSDPWLTTNMSPEQILTFAAAAVSADLDSIPNVVVPGSVGSVRGSSVVHLSGSGRAIWENLADGALEP